MRKPATKWAYRTSMLACARSQGTNAVTAAAIVKPVDIVLDRNENVAGLNARPNSSDMRTG